MSIGLSRLAISGWALDNMSIFHCMMLIRDAGSRVGSAVNPIQGFQAKPHSAFRKQKVHQLEEVTVGKSGFRRRSPRFSLMGPFIPSSKHHGRIYKRSSSHV